MARLLFLATTGAAALSLGSAVAAQPGAAVAPAVVSRTTVYDAAFFKQYAPRSALDIAQRVPGFALDLGNSDVRGFAGAAGNVVINGQRPSNKSEGLDQTLAKIPADQVSRVEVGPGNLYGADYAGKNQVLNIILAAGRSGRIEGNLTVAARRFFIGGLNPTASGSVVIQRGPSVFNLSAGLGNNDNYQDGPDQVFVPADGPLVETRFKRNHFYNRLPFAALSWALGSDADRTAHLNLRYQRGRTGVFQVNQVTPVASPAHVDHLIQHYLDPSLEVGGDVSRPLAGGAVKLVGLATRRKRDYDDKYIGGPPATGGFHQVQKANQDETIGRLSWTRANLGGFSVEAGGEVAYNSLDNRLRLDLINPDGSATPINLPIANATVTERRGETYVAVGKQLSSTLHVDTGVRWETSSLKVRGDASAERSLSFWKPNLAFDWNRRGWHSRLSLRRTVAQLDFYEFISAADLSAGHVNGGNANLVPQQTWEARFTLEHPLLKTGLAKLDLGYDRVNELQDRILTPAGFDAPGNLGTGTRWFAMLTLDAPLDRLGVKGGRLKFNTMIQNTRVIDPSTHRQRHWSDQFDQWPTWQWSIDYRQDLGRFSYGMSVSDQARYWVFRTDEVNEFGQLSPYGSAFVEFRPNARTTITLDVANLLETRNPWFRTFFSPNRSNPVPFERENRVRNQHANVGLTIKRTF
ncbi:MAG: outer membrane beta-barrel protein [Sphingomonas sp.]